MKKSIYWKAKDHEKKGMIVNFLRFAEFFLRYSFFLAVFIILNNFYLTDYLGIFRFWPLSQKKP